MKSGLKKMKKDKLQKKEIFDITRVLHSGSPFPDYRPDIIKDSNGENDFYTRLNEPGAFMSALYNRSILKNFLKKIKTPSLTPNILDAGSGLGFNLPVIFNIYSKANVVALDVCNEALEISTLCCNQKEITLKIDILKRKYGLKDWVLNELFDSRQSGFPRKQVDIAAHDIIDYEKSNNRLFEIVICTEVLEHIEDLQGALTSLCRLVDKKGYLILSFPNYYKNTVASIKKNKEMKKDGPNWSPWDVHEDGRENLINWLIIEKMIKNLDFKIIHRKAANYLLAWAPHLAKRLKYKRTHDLGNSYPMIWLGDLFPYLRRFAMNYFILARPK